MRPCRKFAAKSVSFEPCRMVRCPKTCKHVRGSQQEKRSPKVVSFLVFSFPPLSSHQRHPRATACSDRREALTAYFSVLLAKYGAFSDVRKICQIAQRAILLIIRVSLISLFMPQGSKFVAWQMILHPNTPSCACSLRGIKSLCFFELNYYM